MRGTIDSIEAGMARIELDDGGVCTLPSRRLPAGAKEGDRMAIEFRIDRAETAAAKDRIAALQKRLMAGDDGGDIEL